MGYEDDLRQRESVGNDGYFGPNAYVLLEHLERDAIVDALAVMRNFTDGPGDLASLVDALARLDALTTATEPH
jgi:hypothetical protein